MNLSQYYSSIGKALPTLGERGGLWESGGLGKSRDYRGTAAQNTSLLSYLTKGGNGGGGNPAPSGGGIMPPAPGSEYTGLDTGPSLSEFYNKQLESLGVPGLQKTVQTFKDQTAGVNGLLNNLTEDISARTRGSLTSSAQNDRMNAVEGGVLRNQLSKLGAGAQPAIDALNTALGTADKMTGFFSKDKEEKLSILMDKIHRGQALSDREWQQASDLAKMAQQHKYALSEAAAGRSAAAGSSAGALDIKTAIDDYYKNNGNGGLDLSTPEKVSAFINGLFPAPTTNTPAPVVPGKAAPKPLYPHIGPRPAKKKKK